MPSALAPRFAARTDRLRRHLERADLDAVVVTAPPNIAYLTGLRASAGALVVAPEAAWLLADFRYVEDARAATAVGEQEVTVVPVGQSFDEAIVSVLGARGVRRVGVEAAHLPLKRHQWLQRRLANTARRAAGGSGAVALVATERLVERDRAIKDAGELLTLREAGRLLGHVAEAAFAALKVGTTEREVALAVHVALIRAGFERPAFEPVVASGPNSARPHARPSRRRLVQGDAVVLDFGGVYDGYCVDLTRTASLGPPGAELARLYAAVAEAQAAAIASVRPGILPSAIDAAAREALARRGLAEAFGHGTGHGLGLEVHEEPRIGAARRDVEEAPVEVGMVFTIEPGAYLPGIGGVRLEDDVVVTAGGCELLTDVPRELHVA